ncbi:DNA polymerase III subunit delta [Candidatus Peregrinibacteria bacterium CG11_big_fil_rev_8_21_14_0_20_49_14]|nr:MAG: DNA polymerase III subunit delta [Candidatus Peregrinibacteria bacterium CG11_big_fil_rev_8_21_14_0_20_49_14]
MSQFHLLIGPNSFEISQERLRWKREFQEKHGPENLSVLDGRKITFRDLMDESAVAPFIAQKRLVIVEGVPKGKKGDIAALQDAIHPDVLVLFTLETEPGRKEKLTIIQKELKEASHVKQFPMKTKHQLCAWIDEYLARQGSSVSSETKTVLLSMIGEDQQLLYQEIAKIALYASGRQIQPDDVRSMVACSAEREVWLLMDFLGDGNVDEALRYIRTLLDRGFSPHALWSMFLWMVSLLVQVVAYVEAGEKNPRNIAKDLHTNEAGIRAILPSAKKMNRDFLLRILDIALDADLGLKTGQYKETGEEPEEILALIDRSILSFA